MKKYIKLVFVLAFGIVFSMSSCSKEVSLQKYFVTKSAEEGFMSVTIPSSILQFKEGEDTDSNTAALKSFQRLNVLIFKKDENSVINEKQELETINSIISNTKYKELMSVNIKGQEGTLVYSGADDNINEVVGYGHSDEGFILVRLTGKDMNVKQLAKLVSSIDFDKSNLDDLKNLNIN